MIQLEGLGYLIRKDGGEVMVKMSEENDLVERPEN